MASDKVSNKISEKASDKASDKIFDNTSNMSSDKVSSKISEKTSDKDEKLCKAIVANSTITNINWKGVTDHLGLEKATTAQKRWSRFKAKLNSSSGPINATVPSDVMKTPTDGTKDAGKKRNAKEMSDEGNEALGQSSAGKAKEKKIKFETLGNDEDGDQDGKQAEGGEMENAGTQGDEDYVDDGNSDDSD